MLDREAKSRQLFTATICLLTVLAMNAVMAAETSLIGFSLESPEQDKYTDNNWTGKVLVLFVTDREGAAYNENRVWSRPVTEFIQGLDTADDFALLKIVDVPRMPRLFRGMARNMMKPEADDPLKLSLMDWDGIFASSYDLPAAAYNLLVFGKDRRLLYRAELREFDMSTLEEILRNLDAIVP